MFPLLSPPRLVSSLQVYAHCFSCTTQTAMGFSASVSSWWPSPLFFEAHATQHRIIEEEQLMEAAIRLALKCLCNLFKHDAA